MLASVQPTDNSSSTSDDMFSSVLPPRTPVSRALRTTASVTTAWDSPPLSPVHKRSRGSAAAAVVNSGADSSEFTDSLLDVSLPEGSFNRSDALGKCYHHHICWYWSHIRTVPLFYFMNSSY
jgi:hypothetical protein